VFRCVFVAIIKKKFPVELPSFKELIDGIGFTNWTHHRQYETLLRVVVSDKDSLTYTVTDK
jgi:hypothetical protein